MHYVKDNDQIKLVSFNSDQKWLYNLPNPKN